MAISPALNMCRNRFPHLCMHKTTFQLLFDATNAVIVVMSCDLLCHSRHLKGKQESIFRISLLLNTGVKYEFKLSFHSVGNDKL